MFKFLRRFAFNLFIFSYNADYYKSINKSIDVVFSNIRYIIDYNIFIAIIN